MNGKASYQQDFRVLRELRLWKIIIKGKMETLYIFPKEHPILILIYILISNDSAE